MATEATRRPIDGEGKLSMIRALPSVAVRAAHPGGSEARPQASQVVLLPGLLGCALSRSRWEVLR